MRHRFSSVGLLSMLVLPLACGDPGPLVEDPDDTGTLGVFLGRVAVVTSDNERIEEVLDAYQVTFELYDGFVYGPPENAPLEARYEADLPPASTLLGDATALYPFDVVFLDCGVRGLGNIDPQTLTPDTSLLSEAVTTSVRTWVEDYGGQLYLSDRSFGLLERIWPDLAIFQGDDLSLTEPLQGAPGETTVQIQDAELQEASGLSTLRVQFPFQGWALMEAAQGTVLRGDVPVLLPSGEISLEVLRPVLLRVDRGLGAVTFASFHQEHKIDGDWTLFQGHLLRRLGGDAW